MARTIDRRHEREAAALRLDLAGIAVEIELIRIDRALARKYRTDQPRAPAGGPGGGRWVPEGSGGPDPAVTGSIGGDTQADTRTDEVVTADGSRVLSIRIRADRQADWDEQHTVTAPDGTRTVFETSGLTQTIRDGETGEILGRSTLTADGAVPEAFVQSALSMPPGALNAAKEVGKRLLQSALTLFAALAGRDGGGRKAVFAGPASEYVPGEGDDARAVWAGVIDQAELDRLCPRNQEVQALTDATAAEVRAMGDYKTPQDFGNKVHKRIADKVDALNDPDFIAEFSYDKTTGNKRPSGTKDTLELDLLEHVRPTTVCVYDYKTGRTDLKPRRAVDIMTLVQKTFGTGYRYIMIMMKPTE